MNRICASAKSGSSGATLARVQGCAAPGRGMGAAPPFAPQVQLKSAMTTPDRRTTKPVSHTMLW